MIALLSLLFSTASMEAGGTSFGITLKATPLSYDEFTLPRLTDDEFNSLSTEKKYKVATKLYSTLYYGTDMNDINTSIQSGTFISQIYDMFDQENSAAEVSDVEELIGQYYSATKNGQVIIPILARLFHLTPGKTYFNHWAAYVLTQSILYSPGLELPNVKETDAYAVYYSNLVNELNTGSSLQWITFKHMISQSNWRRFKSPEDNGREMLEIYLYDMNDSHVPLAAQALQNWKLDRGSNTLVIEEGKGNTEPITNLFEGTTVTSGTDFYSSLVLQPDFLPTVTRRLVNIYFSTYTDTQKDDIVSQLVMSNPTAWTDLLKEIIYSKEYLLNSNRMRSFEELFLPIAKTVGWHPHSSSFFTLYDALDKMSQASMTYKLGRAVSAPLNTYSFAWMHKSLRDNLMTKFEKNSSFVSIADGWGLKEIFAVIPDTLTTNVEVAEYMVHSLFISTIGRDATANELQMFKDLVDSDKYDPDLFNSYGRLVLTGSDNPDLDAKMRGYIADLILDYISRLGETYQFITNS